MESPYHVHNWDPILFHITEDAGIRYYGLAYIVSFVIAGILLRLYWQRGRSPVPPELQPELMVGLVLGTLLGARLGLYLFYHPAELFRNPLVLFGGRGMSSHGGFIGVTLALLWMARKHRLSFSSLADITVSFEPIAFSMGRVANYINAEMVGKPTTVPWAVMFPGYAEPRHPSQLYEAVLEGLVLVIYTQWRIWGTSVLKRSPGRLAGEWCIGYAVLRVFVEQFREPDVGIAPVLGLNRGAWISIAFAVGGTLVLLFSRQREAREKQAARAPQPILHPNSLPFPAFTALDSQAAREKTNLNQ